METQPAVNQLQQVADRDQSTDAVITHAAEPPNSSAAAIDRLEVQVTDTAMHNTDQRPQCKANERSSRTPGGGAVS